MFGHNAYVRVVECDVTVFWWLVLARRELTGRVRWSEISRSVIVGSLWREGSFRESCAGLSEVTTVFWKLALEKVFSGLVLVGDKSLF